METTIRILVVDDSDQWRISVRSILAGIPLFGVVGEARDGAEGAEKAATLLPDVVLLDIGMPRLNGIEAARKIRRECPSSRIIFLTQERDSDIREAALAAGGAAYVLKSHAKFELPTTIETAMLDIV